MTTNLTTFFSPFGDVRVESSLSHTFLNICPRYPNHADSVCAEKTKISVLLRIKSRRAVPVLKRLKAFAKMNMRTTRASKAVAGLTQWFAKSLSDQNEQCVRHLLSLDLLYMILKSICWQS